MRRRGWFGDSHGHALAARGVRLYAKKDGYVDPMFYYNQQEEEMPYADLRYMVDKNMKYEEMCAQYPDADHVSLHKRAIQIIDGRAGSSTLRDMDAMGVDAISKMARVNPRFRYNCAKVLQDAQKASFIPGPKRALLQEKIEVRT